MRKHNLLKRLTCAFALLLGTMGCAEEREPINRVQANALDKSFFVAGLADDTDNPQFYWRNFVVDGSEAQELVGIGSWSGVDRIKWEITEDRLIARKAYQPGQGDNKGATHTDGLIVAAFAIEKHFDIVREYNPSTGEQLNVVGENTTDRPWFERKYMRVDWSVNEVDSPLWTDMFQGKVFGDIKVTPVAYYQSDANHPDAPHFDVEDGYFDITSKFFLEPSSMDSPFVDLSGDVPACIVMGIYTGSAIETCDPQEAVIRSSFWRVDKSDPDQDYEPFENTTAELDIIGNPGGQGDAFSVGIVTAPVQEWDPQYGYTDEGMRKYMHRHNMWEQNHVTLGSCSSDADCGGEYGSGAFCTTQGQCSVSCDYDNARDENKDGTEDSCAGRLADLGYSGSKGSQCSPRNRCTLPYRDRTVKPIGYWMNAETPEALQDRLDDAGNVVEKGSTERLMGAWNQAFVFAAAKAREVECRRTGDGNRQACHEQFFEPGKIDMVEFGGWGIESPKDKTPVFVTCHNPVREYDPELCGEVGESARVGDVRKNFLFYWPHASRAPWGGIANWNADPLTGQIIGASATTMGRSATYAAAMVRDIIMVANGELSMEDITSGVPATAYERRLQHGHAPKAYSQAQIEATTEQLGVGADNAYETLGTDMPAGDLMSLQRQRLQALDAASTPIGTSSSSHLKFQAIAGRLQSTEIEADLIDSNTLVDSAGMSPLTPMSDDVLELISPLRGGDSFVTSSVQRDLNHAFSSRGVCFGDHHAGHVGNTDIQGVAAYFAEKYSNDKLKSEFGEMSDGQLSKKRAELIYEDLWKDTYMGIQLHEVGHSIGMLHVFSSSYDSTNFNPQYWQLRTNEGRAAADCEGQVRENAGAPDAEDTCMGPRYLDPPTSEEMGRGSESRPGINYFGHTSTMEYQNERFFETVGLGAFDLHTVSALYGRVLSTFDPEVIPTGEGGQERFGARLFTQLTESELLYYGNPTINSGAVFTQSAHYTRAARLMKIWESMSCRDATDEEKRVAEWRIVNGKVCTHPKKDYAAWQDFVDDYPSPDIDFDTAPKVRVSYDYAKDQIRWPFRWATSNNSYIHANPSDAGADVYETTMATIEKWEYNYPFTYFRRQNRDWYSRSIPSRTANRFYERLRATHWGIANDNARYKATGLYSLVANNDDWHRPYVMAEKAMFTAIAKSLLAPQPGDYTLVDASINLYDTDGGGQFSSPEFILDAATGRYVDPSFGGSADSGGSWSYQTWVEWTGYTQEKSDAAKALTDGRPVLFTISRDNYLDGRNVNINFRTDQPKALDRLLGGVLANDWHSVAMYVPPAQSNELEYPEPQMVDFFDDDYQRPAGSRLVFPNLGYKQQLGLAVWAQIFGRLDSDLTLANKMRVWIDGTSAATVPESEQIRFTNPDTGLTYVARRFGTESWMGRGIETGIASRMLEHANQLLVTVFLPQFDEDSGLVLNEYGQVQLQLDDDGRPKRRQEDTSEAFVNYRGYVGLLDSLVQIQDYVGYGPFNELPDTFD